ncbi:hypothetical protein DUNSADRAFT_2786, partial [Dunaliella salina]
LHALLVVYVESCRGPVLLHAGKDLEVEDPKSLFFSLSTGNPLEPNHLDACFRQVQVQHELALPNPLPQSHLRHILASNRH